MQIALSEIPLSLQEKIKKIKEIFHDKKVLIAFSGGVDSSTLAYLAKQSAKTVLLVNIHTEFSSEFETKNARKVAKELGLPLHTISDDVLTIESIRKNPDNRCYYCKSHSASALKTLLAELEYDLIAEGTNLSDLQGHRPGFQAIKENGLCSPFLEAGVVKDEIRLIAKIAGLSVWDLPSMACLASRIQSFQEITFKKLRRVETLEAFIRQITPVRVLRARDHETFVSIEVLEDEIPLLFQNNTYKQIRDKALHLGYSKVFVDLKGYPRKP